MPLHVDVQLNLAAGDEPNRRLRAFLSGFREIHKGLNYMIEIKNLSKVYEAREGDHHALRGIDLTIEDGDIFGIIGQSGAGKSTLVRCINLLERPTGGSVVIDGKDVTSYQGRDLLNLRSSIGMIFQHFSLFQQRTVLQNVTFPLELRKEPKAKREERARELLEAVGMAGYENRYPSELSGGQQQRVAIARALANNPKVMLCDEATSALDTRTTVSILNLLKDINKKLGVTMVVITHSLAVAQKICNRVAVIDYGEIVEEGPTAEVFSHPKSPITRELIENDGLAAVTNEAGAASAVRAAAAGTAAASAVSVTAGIMPTISENATERTGE